MRSGAIGRLLGRAVRMDEGPGLSFLREPRVCEQIARILQIWRNEGHRGDNRDIADVAILNGLADEAVGLIDG